MIIIANIVVWGAILVLLWSMRGNRDLPRRRK